MNSSPVEASTDRRNPLPGAALPARTASGLLGDCLAEFLGTFGLVSFGCGVAATAVAALPGSGRTAGTTTSFLAAGDRLMTVMGWGLAVTFGVHVAGGVSGAHLNQAVTVAFAVRRRFPRSKVVPYVTAQLIGAFVGAVLVYAVYHDAVGALDQEMTGPKTNGHPFATFSVFSTFPASYFRAGVRGPSVDQVVGAAFTLIFIMAVTDLRSPAVRVFLGPPAIGLAVAAVSLSFGANAGCSINPARGFGPRVFAWALGRGELALPGSFHDHFWIPVVALLIGGLIGVLAYDLFIGDVLRSRGQLTGLSEGSGARPASAHSTVGRRTPSSK